MLYARKDRMHRTLIIILKIAKQDDIHKAFTVAYFFHYQSAMGDWGTGRMYATLTRYNSIL